MIFDPKSIKKHEDGLSRWWEYTTQDGKLFVFSKEENVITVATSTPNDQENTKEFPCTFYGFNEATKYFEELIYKSQNKNKDPQGDNEQPPIGFVNILTDQKEYNVGIKMQDGRNCYVTLTDQIDIDNNVLVFNKTQITDTKPFEKDEKYYIDVIGDDPTKLALYPYSDMEQKGGKVSEKVNQKDITDIQEGKDPFEQLPKDSKPSETEEAEGGSPLVTQIEFREEVAKMFGASSYENLLETYGGLDNVIKQIDEDWSATELKPIQNLLGTNYENREPLINDIRKQLK